MKPPSPSIIFAFYLPKTENMEGGGFSSKRYGLAQRKPGVCVWQAPGSICGAVTDLGGSFATTNGVRFPAAHRVSIRQPY